MAFIMDFQEVFFEVKERIDCLLLIAESSSMENEGRGGIKKLLIWDKFC